MYLTHFNSINQIETKLHRLTRLGSRETLQQFQEQITLHIMNLNFFSFPLISIDSNINSIEEFTFGKKRNLSNERAIT